MRATGVGRTKGAAGVCGAFLSCQAQGRKQEQDVESGRGREVRGRFAMLRA